MAAPPPGTRLQIKAWDNQNYSGNEVRTFTLMFNPENYTSKIEIEYDPGQAKGASASPQNFKVIKPRDLTLEFTIDGTNTVYPLDLSKEQQEATAQTNSDPVDVEDKVNEFRQTCFDYQGKLHRPYYLYVVWGSMSLHCVLKSADIKYTLFNKSGQPLRAKITATFSENKSDKIRANEDKASSPDLTHERIVQQGDTLPLMAYRIYGDSSYYAQVAAVNKIFNFRKLRPGQKILFPPINKSTDANSK